MDQLSYGYNNNTNRPNQLTSVSDAVNPAIYPEDIDGTHAYMYDPIGNLIKETFGRNNTNITWDVYNKVTSVDHENTSPTTYFTYDSQGNRVSKLKSGNAPSTTYYIKDAQGNTISVYNHNNQQGTIQSEAYIYGSSRLGVLRLDRLTDNIQLIPGQASGRRQYALSHYEISNHLGNVLTTVTGRRLGLGDGTVESYEPEIVQTSDYYPFGSTMPGRSNNNSAFSGTNSYRYGFNEDRLVPLCSGNRVNDFTR